MNSIARRQREFAAVAAGRTTECEWATAAPVPCDIGETPSYANHLKRG